jgi:hypothetical protein
MGETGECGEQELNHSDGQAEKFYRELKQRGICVRDCQKQQLSACSKVREGGAGPEATDNSLDLIGRRNFFCVGRRCKLHQFGFRHGEP